MVDQEYSNSLKIPLLHTAPDTETTRSGSGKYPIHVAITVITLMGVLVLLVLSCLHGWSDFSLHQRLIVPIEGSSSPSSQPPARNSRPSFIHVLYVDKDNNNHSCHYCAKKGETRVFYQGVQIAAAPMREFCIEHSGDRNMREHAHVLSSTIMNLQMPVFLRDQLYEETKKRKAVVDMQMSLNHESYNYTLSMNCLSCRGFPEDKMTPWFTWCELSPLIEQTPNHCFKTWSTMLLHCTAAPGIQEGHVEG